MGTNKSSRDDDGEAFAAASPTVPSKHSTSRRRGLRSEQTFHERRRHPSLSLPVATTLFIRREELGDGMGLGSYRYYGLGLPSERKPK
ncbi:uncharacterized protein DS421_16g536180 [Arachis hypogaea]|nr:uncharacterized protein DS421_16g536180 [Arachis hypogaea]